MFGFDIWPAMLVAALALVGSSYHLVKVCWLQPRAERRARSHVERLRREEEAGVPPSPKDYHFAIDFDLSGLRIRDLCAGNKILATADWTEVRKVTAFKTDLCIVDHMEIAFEMCDGTQVQIHEDMAGWNRLITRLPEFLPGCKPKGEWYLAVAFPAFAANATNIYQRLPA